MKNLITSCFIKKISDLKVEFQNFVVISENLGYSISKFENEVSYSLSRNFRYEILFSKHEMILNAQNIKTNDDE